VGRELRITGRVYIRNFMALLEAIEREQAGRGVATRSQTASGAAN
jgi:hypothetical protein